MGGFGDIEETRTDNAMRAFDERHPEDRDAEPGEGFCCTYCYKEFTDEEWIEDGEKLFQLPYLSDEEKMEHYTEAYCSQCSWNTCQTNELCENCIFYGIWDEDNKQVSNLDNLLPEGIVSHQKRSGRLLTPCINCAESNNWQWTGQSCYGSDGDGHFTPEQLARHMYSICQRKHLQEDEDLVSSEDHYWSIPRCLERLPLECREHFLGLHHQQQSVQ